MRELLTALGLSGPLPTLVRILFGVYYLGTGILIHYVWKEYVSRAYWTTWFDVAKAGLFKKLAWKPDIRDLMNKDPLEHTKHFRALFSRQALRDLLFSAFAMCVWVAGWQGLKLLGEAPSKDNIEIATFLIGFLGLAGTATKVTYEWRLKVRSENRQKWIDGMREVLTALIANMPWPDDDEARQKEKKKNYSKQHAKLELLINPSERDHRALVALVRHIYGIDDVHIDRVPRKELGFVQETPDQAALKSQMIRLSNVVLKREWERVKLIQ